MNPRAIEIMRVALERISSIDKPSSAPVEEYDPEELLEKLDFAIVTAREALDRVKQLVENRDDYLSCSLKTFKESRFREPPAQFDHRLTASGAARIDRLCREE
jgi:hypothetical protein